MDLLIDGLRHDDAPGRVARTDLHDLASLAQLLYFSCFLLFGAVGEMDSAHLDHEVDVPLFDFVNQAALVDQRHTLLRHEEPLVDAALVERDDLLPKPLPVHAGGLRLQPVKEVQFCERHDHEHTCASDIQFVNISVRSKGSTRSLLDRVIVANDCCQ